MVRADRSAAVAAAVALAVIAVAGLAIFAIPASEVPLTYRAASPVARVVGLGAGAALVIAALMTTRGSVAVLLLALAAMWFGQDLAALGDSAALVRGVAGGAAPFAAALALHLALALPEGRLSRVGRAAVGTAYVAAAASAVATVTLRDPFLDVYCWRQCSDNPLLVHAAPGLAHAFVIAGHASAIAAGTVAVGVAVWRILAASSRRARPARAGADPRRLWSRHRRRRAARRFCCRRSRIPDAPGSWPSTCRALGLSSRSRLA